MDSEVSINQTGELQERNSLALTPAATKEFETIEAQEWLQAQTPDTIKRGVGLYFAHLFANAYPASSPDDYDYFADRRVELQTIIDNLFAANQTKAEELVKAFGRFAYQDYTQFLWQKDHHDRINPTFLRTEVYNLFSTLVSSGLIEEDVSEQATSYFSERQAGAAIPELLQRYLIKPQVPEKKPEVIDFYKEREKLPLEELSANINGQETRLKVTGYISGVAEGNIYRCETEDGRRFALKVFEVDKMQAAAKGKPYDKRGPEELRDNDMLKIAEQNRLVIEKIDHLKYLWKIRTMFSGPAVAVMIDGLLKNSGFENHLVAIHDYGTLDRKSRQYEAKGWLGQDSSPYLVMDYRPEMAEVAQPPHTVFGFYSRPSLKRVKEELCSGKLPELKDEEVEELIGNTARQLSTINDVSINQGIFLLDTEVLLLRSGHFYIFDTSVSSFFEPPTGNLLEHLTALQKVFYGLDPEKSKIFYQTYRPNEEKLDLIDQNHCNEFWRDQEKWARKIKAESSFAAWEKQT